MKKLVLALSVILGLWGCQQQPAATATQNKAAATTGAFPMAFVNVDSVMAVYDYATDLSKKFETDAKSKQGELQTKAEKFQRRVADFQSKVKQHLITSVQAQKMQKQLAQEEQNLAVLQNKMQQEMSFQEREMLLMLNDSLTAVVNEINKDDQYKMILRNTSMGGNVIVATDDVDLTTQVIEMLNARYATAKKDSVK